MNQITLQFAFWFTLGGFGIWWIADLFRMPSIVRSTNEMIAREALQTLAIGNQFRNSVSLPPLLGDSQTTLQSTPNLPSPPRASLQAVSNLPPPPQ